jgi:hypothetical protein
VTDEAGSTGAEAFIHELEEGPLHRFAQYATLTGVVPGSGAGGKALKINM